MNPQTLKRTAFVSQPGWDLRTGSYPTECWTFWVGRNYSKRKISTIPRLFVSEALGTRIQQSRTCDPALLAAATKSVGLLKFNSTGTAILAGTYLGGSGGVGPTPDELGGMAIDSAGNVYLTGSSSSTDFPTPYTPSSITRRQSSECICQQIRSCIEHSFVFHLPKPGQQCWRCQCRRHCWQRLSRPGSSFITLSKLQGYKSLSKKRLRVKPGGNRKVP